MKRRFLNHLISPGGVLRWSTACILAGSLAGCDRGVTYVATEKDAEMAESQIEIEKMDSEKANLMEGNVSHNFHLPKVGYYHADTRDFFDHPYGYEQDGRYFINGSWSDTLTPASASSSRPTPEALKRVEKALEEEQGSGTSTGGHHGFGMGNALMMYWLLSGNRGMFSPGAGFHHANGQAGYWQRGVEEKRDEVRGYAAANPGYRRMLDQSRASGTTIKPGQSVRGGFGSSSSRGRFSFGS